MDSVDIDFKDGARRILGLGVWILGVSKDNFSQTYILCLASLHLYFSLCLCSIPFSLLRVVSRDRGRELQYEHSPLGSRTVGEQIPLERV